jgi:cytoskeletal protein CcmA (bactofilin family)
MKEEICMEENLQDVKISGAGKIGGGKFREVKISGSGTITGNLECDGFNTSGASTVNGDVKTKNLDVSGSTQIKGNVEAENIKISGGSNITGDVVTKAIKISGASKIRGNLHAEEIEISGSVEIKEDCEAERFKVRGGFEIGGLLNAGDIEISIYGRCRVREIGGEKIDIRRGSGNIFAKMIKFIFVQGERLTTSVIEGDDIYLEATTAKVVRGNNVTIGSDCNIELVEYKSKIFIATSSTVTDQKNI